MRDLIPLRRGSRARPRSLTCWGDESPLFAHFSLHLKRIDEFPIRIEQRRRILEQKNTQSEARSSCPWEGLEDFVREHGQRFSQGV